MKQHCIKCGAEMPPGEAELCSDVCAQAYWTALRKEIASWPECQPEAAFSEPQAGQTGDERA